MVFNNEVLFIHLGKTGGMSVTNYLCNVLKPPVNHVVKKGESESLKQSGHVVFHPWKRHANLVEAASYLKGFGIKLSDFKLIFCVVRNPLDMDYSYYKHLRTERYSKDLFANQRNRRLLVAASGDYETFASQYFTHYHGNLKDFFEINGTVPDNMKFVKFEELAKTVPELIKPFAIKQIPFPCYNKSDIVKTEKTELSVAAINSVFEKYEYIFNNYYPSVNMPPDLALSQTQQPEISDKKYLFISGNDRSGISRINSIIGSHSKIIMGKNRYDKLTNKSSFSLSTHHFTKNRFLNVHEGDTHYADSGRPKKFHSISEKWDRSELIGINIKHSSEVFDNLKKTFKGFYHLYIYRSVFDVVKAHKSNAATEDTGMAHEQLINIVKHWNQTLKTTLDLIQNGESVICVKYEDLLDSGKSLIPIFDKLDLPIDKNVILTLNKVRIKTVARNAKFAKLSAEENEHIASNASLDIMDTLDKNYNILRTKVVPGKKQRPKLTLHIGTEKTGSTSIQEFLHLNRKRLQKQGFAFLESIGYTNHNFLAMAHVSEDKAIEPVNSLDLDDPHQRKVWKENLLNAFKEEVANLGDHIKTVIISSEHFSSILDNIKEVEALNDLFSNYFSSITVIVYLRRQDLIAVSRRSTAYLAGHSSKQSDFEELEQIPFYNYYKLLNMWKEAMPGALIIPRAFDSAEFIDHSLICDFTVCAGINNTSDFKQPKVLNVSLAKSAMDAALFFDFMVDKGLIDYKDEINKEFRLQMLKTINLKFPGLGKKPSRAVARKFLDQYISINRKTAQEWFPGSQLFSDDFSMYPENPDNSTIDIDLIKEVILMLAGEISVVNNIRRKTIPVLSKVGRSSFLKRLIEKYEND